MACVEARRAQERSYEDGKASDLREELEEARGEIKKLQRDIELKAVKAAEEMRVALERQRVELSGDAESQRELLAVKEREARIDLLRRQFARRLVQRELSLGWGAWLEMYNA